VTASVAAKDRNEPSGGSPGPESAARSWRPALSYSVRVYLVVRVGLFLLGAATWGLTSEQSGVTFLGPPQPLTNGWHNAVTGWDKQDALWFLQIAQHGYSTHNASAAFYPAYPILIRVVGYLCLGHLLLAAYLVSNAALVAALVILYRLTEREYDEATARRTVLYLCVFPTAFFLFDTYSEALFLLTAVSAFALARSGRWGWAGLTGIAATLTRSAGVAVVLALVAEAVHQAIAERRGAAPVRATRLKPVPRTIVRLGASVLPLAGIGGYLLFWQLRYDDWYTPIRLENSMWGRVFTTPWQTLWRGLTMAWRYGQIGNSGWWTLDFVLVAAGIVLAIWVAFRARPIYAVFTWASILLFLCASWPDRPLASDPRYLVTIFPLIWPLARLGRRPGAHEAIVGVSAAAMAIVGWLFLSTTLVF
jgi:Mannosyltransferase (PIG-V)